MDQGDGLGFVVNFFFTIEGYLSVICLSSLSLTCLMAQTNILITQTEVNTLRQTRI